LRDVIVLFLLTAIGGFLVGLAVPGNWRRSPALLVSNLLFLVLGFAISASLARVNRWQHIAAVAAAVWVVSVLNIVLFGVTFVDWFLSLIGTGLTMAIGGGLSYLFAPAPANTHLSRTPAARAQARQPGMAVASSPGRLSNAVPPPAATHPATEGDAASARATRSRAPMVGVAALMGIAAVTALVIVVVVAVSSRHAGGDRRPPPPTAAPVSPLASSLPDNQVALLRAEAKLEGTRLTVTVYNGSIWTVRSLVLAVSYSGEASSRTYMAENADALSSALAILGSGLEPNKAGTFSVDLGLSPGGRTVQWSIIGAKGIQAAAH
jgi:hypothetical protein